MSKKSHPTAVDRLLQVIELRKLGSKSSLAEGLGITAGAIYNAEKRGEVTPLMAHAVEGVYGISAKWILSGEGSIAPVSKLNLDMQMYMEMLPLVREIDRKAMKKLSQLYFDKAFRFREQAEIAIAWEAVGKEMEDDHRFKAELLKRFENSSLYSEFRKNSHELTIKCEEVSTLLWNARFFEKDSVSSSFNAAVFDESIQKIFRHRIFIDCVKEDLSKLWERESQNLSKEQYESVAAAYEHSQNLRSEAEEMFSCRIYGDLYAQRMMFKIDSDTTIMRGKLAEKQVHSLWEGELSAEEIYRYIRKG